MNSSGLLKNAPLNKTIPYFITWNIILPPKQVSSELVIPVTGFIYITAQALSLTHLSTISGLICPDFTCHGLVESSDWMTESHFFHTLKLGFKEHMNIKFITNEHLEFIRFFMRLIFRTFIGNLYSKCINSYKIFYDIVEFSLREQRSWYSYSSTNILSYDFVVITYLSLLMHEMRRIILK